MMNKNLNCASTLPNNSSSVTTSSLHSWFVTGFTDGEGSFGIYFAKNSKYQLGYQLKYEFTIALHKKDRALLENIKQGSLGRE